MATDSQHNDLQPCQGIVTICPTPIGNLGDISDRMRDALNEAEVVYCEDTRVTGKLLHALGIHKPLHRLDENTMRSQMHQLLDDVRAGKHVVYCSDAGMPGVSDPGMPLIDAALDQGLHYEVLPGPSAAVLAYVASGASSPRYYFGGFFPRKQNEQHTLLQQLAPLDAALVFYESPHRIIQSLGAIDEVFPVRRITVCRELTKLHEDIVRGTAAVVKEQMEKRQSQGTLKGEIAFVIDAAPVEEEQKHLERKEESARLCAEELLRAGDISRKDIIKHLQNECGLSRNAAYELVLSLTQ